MDNTSIDISTNYVKMGNRVFTLQETTHPIQDIEKALQQYAESKLKNTLKSMQEALIANNKEDMQYQLNVLNKHISAMNRQASIIRLPDEYINVPVFYDSYSKTWARIDSFIYRPTKMKTSLNDLSGKVSGTTYENIKVKILEILKTNNDNKAVKLGNEQIISLVLQNNYSLPATYSIHLNGNKLYMHDTYGFHTYSDGHNCTGNLAIKKLFAMPHFQVVDFLNTINGYSMANQRVTHMDDVAYTLGDLLKATNIKNVIVEGAWTIE